MDHIDPVKIGNFHIPVTGEIALETKKKLRESKMETDKPEKAGETEDIYEKSEMARGLEENKKSAFLKEARSAISNLNPDSESFVDDATHQLVNSALRNEYGDDFSSKKEFGQMEEILTRNILRDVRYREIMERFLGKILETEEVETLEDEF